MNEEISNIETVRSAYLTARDEYGRPRAILSARMHHPLGCECQACRGYAMSYQDLDTVLDGYR